jgi:GNAT superfamily N-acetyltransferase
VLPALPAGVIFEEVVVAPRRAYLPLAGLRVVERPGWLQLVTPALKQGGLNEVAHAALDAGEADAVIDVVVAEYRALGVRFRWTVGPDSAPPDLAERLERRGLERGWTRGMARSTEGLSIDVDARASVEAGAAAPLDAFTRVMAEGWGVDPGELAPVNAAALADGAGRHRLYLARWGGEPAATAAYVALPRSAYLLGGVVLPRFRGRGLYRALVGARLDDARARGLALATSHAREATSAPLLAKMGFEGVCRFPVFHG